MDKANKIKRNQEILREYNLGKSYSEMANIFGMSKGGVHKIIRNILHGKDIPDFETESKINIV